MEPNTTPIVSGPQRNRLWFQFSLRSLFALTAFMAVGLTALKFSTHGWSIAVTTLTAAFLLFAILQAIHGRDSARPFWSGFAIFGWGYMAILLFWGASENSVLGNNLATNEFLDFLFLKFNPTAEENGGGLSGGGGLGGGGAAFDVPDTGKPITPNPQPNSPPAAAPDPFGGDQTSLRLDTMGDGPPVLAPQPPADTIDIGPPTPPGTAPVQIDPAEKAAQEATELLQLRRVYFPRIGHCLFTLLIGWIGGLVAQGIASMRKETQLTPPTMSDGK